MAELNLGKGLTAGKVASNVQKKLTRAQEKVRVARQRVNGGREDAVGEGGEGGEGDHPGLRAARQRRHIRPPPGGSVASRHHNKHVQGCRRPIGGWGPPPPSSITSLSYSISFSGHVHVALLIIQPMTDVFLALHYITFPVIQ